MQPGLRLVVQSVLLTFASMKFLNFEQQFSIFTHFLNRRYFSHLCEQFIANSLEANTVATKLQNKNKKFHLLSSFYSFLEGHKWSAAAIYTVNYADTFPVNAGGLASIH